MKLTDTINLIIIRRTGCEKASPRWFGPTRLPIVSRRSGQDGLARPVCLLCPEGRAKIARPDPFAYWVQKVGPRWFGRPVCLLGPEGRAKMVWTDPFAYCVQKVGPRWFGSTGLPIGSRLQNVGPTYLGPTRPDPTGWSARQQVCIRHILDTVKPYKCNTCSFTS